MRLFYTAALAWLLNGTAWAGEAPKPQPVKYEMVKERSWLRFEATQNDALVRSEFKNFRADILFHPENAEASRVRVTIGLKDIATAYEDLAANLLKPEWFDAAQWPEAVFETKQIITASPGHYIAKGDLTLRGVAKPVEINFMYEKLDLDAAVVEGVGTIKRLDFGVGQGEWEKTNVVKNDVVVRFRVEAVQKP